MINKILITAAAISVVLLPALTGAATFCALPSGATTTNCMTSGGLGGNIASVNTTAYAYIGVLLTNYWPFVLGFIILLGVIAFGKRITTALFHG